MEGASQKLKRARERLNLRYRDVEEHSQRIAEKLGNDEFAIALSRLADIENRGTVPSIYRIYTLCAIYRLDLLEVLDWYGVSAASLPASAALVEVERTHLIQFNPAPSADVKLPVAIDPVIDTRKTTYLSRLIQRWGTLPLSLLEGADLKNHRYAFIGSDDWSMYPILHPGSLVMIDETKRKIAAGNWSNEFERPIYFLEHRGGWVCGWCAQTPTGISVLSHPSSPNGPALYALHEIEVIGQVTAVAMVLGRRARS
jgi:transcriptional regulator with XRE-family HTH domain